MATRIALKRGRLGFGLVMLALCLSALTLPLSLLQTSKVPMLAVVQAASDLHESLLALSLIKGYSRAEELGSANCPDTDTPADGLPNTCAANLSAWTAGQAPFITRVAYNQLSLSPSLQRPRSSDLTLRVDAPFTSGLDVTQGVYTTSPAGAVATAWQIAWRDPHAASSNATGDGYAPDTPLRVRKADAQRTDAQLRVRAAFFQHLQQAAQYANSPVSPSWAFGQTLHLRHDPGSSGQRFLPLVAGCTCRCTSIRCKCACLQPSRWLSNGACLTEADAGSCQTTAEGSICQASANQFCYFKGSARLANHWPVSSYSPRATEGKACRPDRLFECPTTAKSGTECSCQFDWPKPLDSGRLQRLWLGFVNGSPTTGMAP